MHSGPLKLCVKRTDSREDRSMSVNNSKKVEETLSIVFNHMTVLVHSPNSVAQVLPASGAWRVPISDLHPCGKGILKVSKLQICWELTKNRLNFDRKCYVDVEVDRRKRMIEKMRFQRS